MRAAKFSMPDATFGKKNLRFFFFKKKNQKNKNKNQDFCPQENFLADANGMASTDPNPRKQ